METGITGQAARKASLIAIALALLSWAAVEMQTATDEFALLRAAVAFGAAMTILVFRELSKRWDKTVVIRGEKPGDPEEPEKPGA